MTTSVKDKEGEDREIRGEEDHVKKKAGVGVVSMKLKKTRIANSHQKLEVDPLDPLEPCQYFNFGLLTFRPVRKFIPFVLSHLFGSNLLQQPSVQSLSCVQLFATQWTAAHQASLSISHSRSLHKLMSIESVMTSNHLILCPLLLLPSIFPSIRVFSNESVLCIRWPKYWISASASVLPMNIQD